jgi:cytohesin
MQINRDLSSLLFNSLQNYKASSKPDTNNSLSDRELEKIRDTASLLSKSPLNRNELANTQTEFYKNFIPDIFKTKSAAKLQKIKDEYKSSQATGSLEESLDDIESRVEKIFASFNFNEIENKDIAESFKKSLEYRYGLLTNGEVSFDEFKDSIIEGLRDNFKPARANEIIRTVPELNELGNTTKVAAQDILKPPTKAEYHNLVINTNSPNYYGGLDDAALKRARAADDDRAEYLIQLFRPVAEHEDNIAFQAIKNNSALGLEAARNLEIDFTSKNSQGDTLVHAAVNLDKPEMLVRLDQQGVDLNALNDKQEPSLITAYKENKLIPFKTLVKLKANLDLKDSDGKTALHHAIEGDRFEELDTLIKAGADVNLKDPDGRTPAMLAINLKRNNALSFLMDSKRVNINEKDAKGENALMKAAASGNSSMFTKLSMKAADPMITNNEGKNSLDIAIENGAADIVKVISALKGSELVHSTLDKVLTEAFNNDDSRSFENVLKINAILAEHSSNEIDLDIKKIIENVVSENKVAIVNYLITSDLIDFNIKNDDGWTPLGLARKNNAKDVIKLILEKYNDIDKVDSNGITDLTLASYSGDINKVVELIKSGADVNFIHKDSGATPLHIAVPNGHNEVVKTLIQSKADINKAEINGWTPLHIAAENGHNEVVKTLIQSNADINQANINGWTPLNTAALNGHNEVVKTLIQSNADINQANINGWTPLNTAALNGHNEVVKTLIQSNADINKAEINGWTPLHIAAQYGHNEVVKTLIQSNADINKPNKDGWTLLGLARKNNAEDVTKLILEKYNDIDKVDSNGMTDLTLAACSGDVNKVVELIKSGADVNFIHKDSGASPLHFAALNGHNEVVKTLIQSNADINKAENDGWNPLHTAAHEGYDKVVKTLIQSNADINKAQNDGWTPVLIAAEKGHHEVVKILKAAGAK